MNVLIDTNVVLDVILQREPWLVEAADVWAACELGLLHGHLQASVTTDIFYIVRRACQGRVGTPQFWRSEIPQIDRSSGRFGRT